MPVNGNKPNQGTEFFFSSIMIKVLQIPALFTTSSECPRSAHNGAFIILIFEKSLKKRTYARSKMHF
jgi:hypothetical protein